jgi:phage terminase large subunit GpA-like protein
MSVIGAPEQYSDEWLIFEGVRSFCEGFIKGLEIPPRLTISEWADQNRVLSSESSAEPGQWSTSRAEYQRGIMDAISDISTEQITIIASAQVGKTEMLNNAVGYYVDKDPCPILMLQPTVEIARSWMTDRLMPMMRDTPCLQGRLLEGKDNGNTAHHRAFPGGHITMVGANSAAGLASRPIRIVLLDEVDRYPLSAGKEGDPSKLAIKRTTTFWNRKIVRCSTPTVAGLSKIDTAFKQSDMRYYYVPCPHCGEFQRLKWSQVKWNKDETNNGIAKTAVYVCEHCGACWNDVERWHSIGLGEWRATKHFNGHAGFALWEGYSPWVKLEEIVQTFLDAKDDPEELKTFINTSLGEVWEDKGERVDEDKLVSRRETYTKAPAEVVVITAGVDVQDNRLEIERIGWTVNNQSYGLGKKIILGDPGAERIWEELDELLQTPIEHELVGEMSISACCIDSGYLTQMVGKFCQERWNRRVWAVKGMAGEGRPIIRKAPGKLKKTNLDFFLVGTDSIKDVIYSRLKLEDPQAPGYCHFNLEYDENHFLQLTAEEAKISYIKGRKIRYYTMRPGRKRNEALDIFGYSLAALEGLKLAGLNMRKRWERMLARQEYSQKVRNVMAEHPDVSAESIPKPDILKPKKRRRVVGRFT